MYYVDVNSIVNIAGCINLHDSTIETVHCYFSAGNIGCVSTCQYGIDSIYDQIAYFGVIGNSSVYTERIKIYGTKQGATWRTG